MEIITEDKKLVILTGHSQKLMNLVPHYKKELVLMDNGQVLLKVELGLNQRCLIDLN